jgi:hypothetical protein
MPSTNSSRNQGSRATWTPRTGGPGRVGLAGADVANYQRNPGAVPGDLADHRRLIGIQARPGLEGGADMLAGDDRGLLASARFGLLDQAPLQVEHPRVV